MILIVDDDHAVLHSLELLLKQTLQVAEFDGLAGIYLLIKNLMGF